MAVRTDPEEARNNEAPGPGKRSPFVAPPSVRPHRKAQPWGRDEGTERKPVPRSVQPMLDRLAVKVGPEPEPVEPTQPPPPPPEPDPVVPPSPEVPEEEDVVLLRVPKETLIRIIEEIVMSQNNQNNTNKNDTTAQAGNENANAKVQAGTENVQASVETPAGAAKVEVKVDAAPTAPSAKASKWKQIGTHTGAALVGAGLAVGGYFLNRHLRGGAAA